jgi:hypothetical protein
MQRIERAIEQQPRAVVLEASFCSLKREVKKCGSPGCQRVLGAVEPAMLRWLEKPDPNQALDPAPLEERQQLISWLKRGVIKVVDGEYGFVTMAALLSIVSDGPGKNGKFSYGPAETCGRRAD